jgi:hypothetical protein
MTQPSTKQKAYLMINDIVAVPERAAIIEANVAKMTAVGIDSFQLTVKVFMRLIGVLFSNQYAPLFANVNDAKKAKDFEKRRENDFFFDCCQRS